MPPKSGFARPSFKPPRPAKAPSKPTAAAKPTRTNSSKASKPSASKAQAATVIDSSDEGDNDAFDDSILDDIDHDLGSASVSKAIAPASSSQLESAIPRDLLVRMLHEHFRHSDTRITQDAADVLTRYMELFVREAMARAAKENSERDGDGFLEVCCQEDMSSRNSLTSQIGGRSRTNRPTTSDGLLTSCV